MNSDVIKYSDDVTEKEILEKIKELNNCEEIFNYIENKD